MGEGIFAESVYSFRKIARRNSKPVLFIASFVNWLFIYSNLHQTNQENQSKDMIDVDKLESNLVFQIVEEI